MLLKSKGLSDPGCVRIVNEDRIIFDDALGLYVVCDGLGGRRKGEVAAELAASTIQQYVESSRDPMDVTWPYGYNLQISLPANRLITAAKLANRKVWRLAEESLECLGMGTTISAVLVDSHCAAVVNVGDSRVYLCRGGNLEQLSIDDTIGGQSAGSRDLSPDEERYPQIRNVLTRAAGSQENLELHLQEIQLADATRVLLCSDGLHGCVPAARMRAIVNETEDPAVAAQLLVTAARELGAPDNVSAVIFDFSTAEPSPPAAPNL
jgi:PPM family protein phosphatase